MGCCDKPFLGWDSLCDCPSYGWFFGKYRCFWVLRRIKHFIICRDILGDARYGSSHFIHSHCSTNFLFLFVNIFFLQLFFLYNEKKRNEATNSRRTRLCFRCPNIEAYILSSQDFPSLLDSALHLFPQCRTQAVLQLWWSWIHHRIWERQCALVKEKKDFKKNKSFILCPYSLSLHFTHTFLTFTPHFSARFDDTFDDDKIFSTIDM